MSNSNKIDAYQMGREAHAALDLLPALRFPLDENREHNKERWESHHHINPFPKGEGALKEAGGLHYEWQRGWCDYQRERLDAWFSLRQVGTDEEETE